MYCSQINSILSSRVLKPKGVIEEISKVIQATNCTSYYDKYNAIAPKHLKYFNFIPHVILKANWPTLEKYKKWFNVEIAEIIGESYLAEQFRQITHYLAEQFRQIAHYLAEHLIQNNDI